MIKRFLLFAFVLLILPLAYAAESAKESANPPPAIPVTYAGVDVFEVVYGVGAFSPAERAAALTDRLTKLANSKTFDAATLTISDDEQDSQIVAGDTIMLSLTDRDASARGMTRAMLAKQTQLAIRSAIETDRANRSPHNFALALSYAAGITLAMILILVGVLFATKAAAKFISRAKGSLIKPLRIRSMEILTEHRIAHFALWLIKVFRTVAIMFLFYIYLPLVLSLFPWTANFAPKLLSFVIIPLKDVAHVIINFLPSLFLICVIIVISRYVLSFIRVFFKEIESGTLQFEGFHQEWAAPTYKLVRVLVIAFTVVVIFPYIPGSSSPAFQGVSVFLGVLVSFGSSSSIGNIVAGIILTYMRPFKLGDRVKISETTGDVIEKTLLVTRIRTIKNEDVTIPNSMILGSHIFNYSSSALSEGLVLHTTVTIGYDAPWKIVHDLLIRAALKTDGIVKTPAPFVLQTSLDDFYVSYQINAYTREPNHMASIYSKLHENIQDSFNAAGVEIMSPHYKALRDGNEVTIPAENREAGYQAPRFRVETETSAKP